MLGAAGMPSVLWAVGAVEYNRCVVKQLVCWKADGVLEITQCAVKKMVC